VTASLQHIAELADGKGPVVRVLIIKAQGSTPREIGAAMIVEESSIAGTIGGGALEYDAIKHARKMLADDVGAIWRRDVKEYPLGPTLGQCCGGHVRLLFERFGEVERSHLTQLSISDALWIARPVKPGGAAVSLSDWKSAASAPPCLAGVAPPTSKKAVLQVKDTETNEEWVLERPAQQRLPIYLYGAGHVAREVVRVFAGIDVSIVWVDTDESRFPSRVPQHATRMIATAPHSAVAYAPNDAFHVVMTCSHPADLEVCHAVLNRGAFRYLGLIGSLTKRERFLRRLRQSGISDDALSRLVCPIGAGGPAGKAPGIIAIALASEILRLAE